LTTTGPPRWRQQPGGPAAAARQARGHPAASAAEPGRARANPERLDFDDLPVPAFTGLRTIEPDLVTLRDLIDWQFFFLAWELKASTRRS